MKFSIFRLDSATSFMSKVIISCPKLLSQLHTHDKYKVSGENYNCSGPLLWEEFIWSYLQGELICCLNVPSSMEMSKQIVDEVAAIPPLEPSEPEDEGSSCIAAPVTTAQPCVFVCLTLRWDISFNHLFQQVSTEGR